MTNKLRCSFAPDDQAEQQFAVIDWQSLQFDFDLVAVSHCLVSFCEVFAAVTPAVYTLRDLVSTGPLLYHNTNLRQLFVANHYRAAQLGSVIFASVCAIV